MWPQPTGAQIGVGGASAECSLLFRVDGFRCLADIVVATPGRLVDHVDQTPGFSLQHLRFLVGCPPTQREAWAQLTPASPTGARPPCLQVIDEADRMIDSMHQSWLPRVVAAAFPGEGAKDPFVLLQRRQSQVVTAARYWSPARPCPALPCESTRSGLSGSGGWAARPRLRPSVCTLSAPAALRCPCRSCSSRPR